MEQEPIEGDEREPEEIAKEIESRDPFEPRLKKITDDRNVIVSKN